MRQSRLSRVLVSAVMAGSAVAALNSSAGAAVPGIACKSVTGNYGSTQRFTKCTGNTGHAAKPVRFVLYGDITLNWKNTKATTTHGSWHVGDSSKCATGSTAYDFVGKTITDTTGSVVIGGKVKASFCVDAIGVVTFVPGTKLRIA